VIDTLKDKGIILMGGKGVPTKSPLQTNGSATAKAGPLSSGNKMFNRTTRTARSPLPTPPPPVLPTVNIPSRSSKLDTSSFIAYDGILEALGNHKGANRASSPKPILEGYKK